MATPTFILGDKNWGIKESNLLGATPVNNGYLQRALTFNSSADITRTNSSGNVQRSPWNIIQYSNAFSNAVWTKNFSSISSSTISSPIGTTDVSLWSEDTTNNQHRMYISNSNVGIFTASVYVKYSGRQYFGIRIYNNDGTKYALKLYDVLNGTLGTQNVAGLGATSSITSVGNGWYRCVLTIDTSITNSNLLFFLADTNTITDAGGTTYTGNGSGVYLWGAQLVEGSQPLDYLSTTNRLNIPRIDYSQGVGCLLLEPQRTNLILQSDGFNNSTWEKLNSSSVSLTSGVINPSGGTNSFKYIASNLAFGGILRQFASVASGVSYTFSIFAKKDNYRYVGIRINTSINAQRFPNYDFDTDTLNTQGVAGATLSRQIFPNGWVRLILTFTTTTTAGNADIALTTANGDTSTALSGGQSVFIWGAQFEAGSFATSYIPTTSASVTRIADTFSRSNIYTDGLISSAGGTWVVELRNNISYVRDISVVGLFLGDNAGITNSLAISAVGGGGRLRVGKFLSSIYTQLYLTTTDSVKIAIKWNGTIADIFVNGSKVVSATVFTATALEFLNHSTSNDVPKYIKSMSLYNTPLSDSECAQITSDIKN